MGKTILNYILFTDVSSWNKAINARKSLSHLRRGAMSQLENFSLDFSTWAILSHEYHWFVHLFLPICCFSTLVKYHFEISTTWGQFYILQNITMHINIWHSPFNYGCEEILHAQIFFGNVQINFAIFQNVFDSDIVNVQKVLEWSSVIFDSIC